MQEDQFKELYPFESNFLDRDGLKYHYIDEGEGDPIVMVHGNPTWSFYYRELIKSFSGTHRVVVPDHIGCGFSDKPQDYDYCLKNHIDNLEALIESLDLDKITLVVHDWGGAIGSGYAVRHPEKISKIVVFNTAAFLLPDIPFRIRVCRIPLLGALAVRGFNAFAGAAVSMACKNKAKMTPAVKDGFLRPYNNWANRIATHRFVLDIPLKPSHPTWDTMVEIQEKLSLFKDTPVLVCWGMKDFCFSKVFLDKWREVWPHADYHCYEDAGHYVILDKEDEVIQEMNRFLSVAE